MRAETSEKFDKLLDMVIDKQTVFYCNNRHDPTNLYLGAKEVEIVSKYFENYFDLIAIDPANSMVHGLKVFVVDADSHLEVL